MDDALQYLLAEIETYTYDGGVQVLVGIALDAVAKVGTVSAVDLHIGKSVDAFTARHNARG